MRSFEVQDMTPDEFVVEIQARLAARDFDRYVSIGLEGDQLDVTLRWMGTTRFTYRIESVGEGFRAELASQKVSPFHAPFADRFEGYFDDALAKVGAIVS